MASVKPTHSNRTLDGRNQPVVTALRLDSRHNCLPCIDCYLHHSLSFHLISCQLVLLMFLNHSAFSDVASVMQQSDGLSVMLAMAWSAAVIPLDGSGIGLIFCILIRFSGKSWLPRLSFDERLLRIPADIEGALTLAK